MSETPTPEKERDWEQRYIDGDLPWDSGRPDSHMERELPALGLPAGKALDLGCGTGTNAIWLAQQGHDVTGLDLSPTAIDMARKKGEAAGVEVNWELLDLLEGDPPGGPFAFAYDRGCFHIFENEDNRTRFAERIAANLEEGGLWLSVMGSTEGPPRDHGPPRRSARDITTAVEPHFEILRLEDTVFRPEEDDTVRAWVMVARRRD